MNETYGSSLSASAGGASESGLSENGRQGAGADPSFTLNELEHKLRELELDLASVGQRGASPETPFVARRDDRPWADAGDPEAARLINEARDRMGALTGQIDELLRFGDQLQRSVSDLVADYGRMLSALRAGSALSGSAGGQPWHSGALSPPLRPPLSPPVAAAPWGPPSPPAPVPHSYPPPAPPVAYPPPPPPPAPYGYFGSPGPGYPPYPPPDAAFGLPTPVHGAEAAAGLRGHSPPPFAPGLGPAGHFAEPSAPGSGAPDPTPAAPAGGVPSPAPSPHEDFAFGDQVAIDAGPFADVGTLSAFEQAIGRVASVSDVYVRGFDGNRALVDVALAGPLLLVRELRAVLPFAFSVRQAFPDRLSLDLNLPGGPGPGGV